MTRHLWKVAGVSLVAIALAVWIRSPALTEVAAAWALGRLLYIGFFIHRRCGGGFAVCHLVSKDEVKDRTARARGTAPRAGAAPGRLDRDRRREREYRRGDDDGARADAVRLGVLDVPMRRRSDAEDASKPGVPAYPSAGGLPPMILWLVLSVLAAMTVVKRRSGKGSVEPAT